MLERESDLKRVSELLDCINTIYTAMGCGDEEVSGPVRVEQREDPKMKMLIADLVDQNE